MSKLSKIQKEDIEKKAHETMEQTGLSDSNEPIDAVTIARKLGFKVGNAVMEDDDDGFIIINDGTDDILGIKTNKLIGVNSARPLEWKRFIIAHEIAHYVLHYPEVKDKRLYAHRDHAKGKNEDENDADFFAACLLMPRELFTKRYDELKEKSLELKDIVVLLADRFCVTQLMAERRIGELKLNE